MLIATEAPSHHVLAPMSRTGRQPDGAAAADTLILTDGTRLRFRPVGSDDREALAGLFARLTPESRRRRFLSPKRELTPRELAFLTATTLWENRPARALLQRFRFKARASQGGVLDLELKLRAPP